MAKKYYTYTELSGDKDHALKPPVVMHNVPIDDPDYGCTGRQWQSAPSIALAGGILWCGFSGDNGKSEEGPNNYNTISISCDDGETWEHNVLVIDHMDAVRLHEALLWTAPDGTLYHFWSQSYQHWDGRGGVWMIRCANPQDENPAWTEPKRICDGVLATKPIVLQDGRWMFPVSIWKNIPNNEFNYLPELTYSNVYITDDGCETMTFTGYVDEPDTVYDENAIVQRDDGSILMLIRTKSIACAESFDLGKSWTESKPFVLPGPSSRLYLSKFSDGSLLVVTHYQYIGRSHMTALRSTDGGKSWNPIHLLDERRKVSYPDGFITEDDIAYVVYDRERHTDREILLSVFDASGRVIRNKTIVSKCP